MASEVRHQVDGGQAYPVVRLDGVLDAGSAPRVLSAIYAVLADQPEAVILDVTALEPAEPGAPGLLREVVRVNADWPCAHLVLCATGSGWQDAGMPVWATQAQAFDALGEPDRHHQLNLPLDPVVGAARRARELVTEACARWNMPELTGPACIVVTELVNNVVAHAHTPMTVLLALHGDTVSIAVRDDSPAAPRFSGPVVPTAYGGRGLLLIGSVARRWGNLAIPGGKVVWALLDGDDAEAEPARRHLDGAGMADPARG